MKYLVSPFRILRNTDTPLWIYLPYAALLSFIPAALISIAIFHYFPYMERVAQEVGSLLGILSLSVLAPVVESIIMLPIVILLQRLTNNRWYISAAISALLWAMFHSAFNPVWGFQVVWSFFIFSVVMITWLKCSKVVAVAVTAWVHAIQNIIGVLLLLTSA